MSNKEQPTKINLEDFSNIDKYINWYRDLSTKIFVKDIWKERYKSYILNSYLLHLRYVRNKNNEKSKQLSKEFSKIAHSIETDLEHLNQWETQISGKPLFFIPTPGQWQEFDLYRNIGLETNIAQLNEKLKRYPKAEKELYQSEKESKNGNINAHFAGYIETGNPILQYHFENEANFIIQFAFFISDIDFCNWVNKKLTAAGNPTPGKAPEKLKWNGAKKELSELIKALALTSLGGTPETDIIKSLAPLFEFTDSTGNKSEFNPNRHRQNIKDLEYLKKKDLFTHRQNKALESYLSKKLDR